LDVDLPSLSSKDIIDQVYKSIVLEEDDGQRFIKLDEDGLNTLRDIGLSQLSGDLEARKAYCDRMFECLSCCQAILAGLPRDFNYLVKYSIASLGEMFTQTMNFALERMQIPRTFGRMWSVGFLNQDAKEAMKRYGWCPSDIARAEAKYHSIQTLYLVQMLDKSLPPRDHTRCTDEVCNTYQINLGSYQSKHQLEDCSCDDLVVNATDLTNILLQEEKYPMLRFKGGVEDLGYDIVESGLNTPYVAISHVWADGLGNPFANSLPKCKLYHLQELVKAVMQKGTEGGEQPKENPLIWLDTLCCPAQEGVGKKTAIEKIRLVYRQAQHVLVLDAGLMSYESKSQKWPETMVRIFTSSWMRRLWTLQEGALAHTLFFQFADDSVSFNGLFRQAMDMRGSMRHSVVWDDFVKEYAGLISFFAPSVSAPAGDNPELSTLDGALMFRSVSVATDEPLCIGTLMSLDLHEILQVEPKENRMQKVWELIALKKGGIPSEIIFFEEERIQAPGWGWAPQSLLPAKRGLQKPVTRPLRWKLERMGKIDPRGLRVQYPGYRIIKREEYGDGRPSNPWPGMPRLSENWLQFRDANTKRWHRIADNKLAVLSMGWTTEEQRHEYNKLGLFPLHDLADSRRSVLVMNPRETANEAVFATIINEEEGIAVKTERQAIVKELDVEEGYIFDVIERLALQLRRDEMTDHHLGVYSKLIDGHKADNNLEKATAENEQFQESLEALKNRMKELMAHAVQEDERLVAAINVFWGASFAEHLWVLIQDFFTHDLLGETLSDYQVWFVD
jgi:hypothetical protein